MKAVKVSNGSPFYCFLVQNRPQPKGKNTGITPKRCNIIHFVHNRNESIGRRKHWARIFKRSCPLGPRYKCYLTFTPAEYTNDKSTAVLLCGEGKVSLSKGGGEKGEEYQEAKHISGPILVILLNEDQEDENISTLHF